MKFPAILSLLAASLSLAPAALADQSNTIPNPKGFYATLGLGASWPQSVDVDDSDLNRLVGTNVDVTFKARGGFTGETGIGYDFGDVRTELTYAYQNSGLESVKLTAAGASATATQTSGGNINANSVFASVYYDIPTKSRWVPYVGGGIGYTNLSVSNVTGTALGYSASLDGGTQNLFGYQAKVGLSYLIDKTFDVFGEAVYAGTTGFSIGSTSYGAINTWGGKLGLRYRFGN